MKKIMLFYLSLIFSISNVNAIKVKLTAASTSVNIAEGSTGVFVAFELYPNNFVDEDTLNARGLIDFPNIIYNNIKNVIIEKALLNKETDIRFTALDSFLIAPNVTFGNKDDGRTIQGNSYVYRISVKMNDNQEFNLLQRVVTPQIANPVMNCAKLNNVYRLAGHNNFQESVISPGNGGFYRTLDFTRAVELDVHSTNNPGTWNWNVRHIGNGNKNNCGYGTTGDKNFGICINDIKKWHLDHPNHDVIILFIDLKSDWNENNNNQTPYDLDQQLLSLVPNSDMIYKPKDILGTNINSNSINMKLSAQDNNWPSMGDLTGKLMFVLTGSSSRTAKYIAERGLDGIAFTAGKVKYPVDVVNAHSSRIFYNINLDDIAQNTGSFASGKRYISRIWDSAFFGNPLPFSNNEYAQSIDEDINNIAVKDVDGNYNPSNNRPVNGIQRPIRAIAPLIDATRVYSNYKNVTQAATETITATNLIVEQGANYRMIAGDEIDLQPGVDFQSGSDVDVRIDDCEGADYSMRKANNNPLTPEEIAAIMHELNKDLYGYVPQDEEKIERLMVYPNPTNNEFTISYRNYLLNQATLTIYDITGRTVKTQTYQPTQEGLQNFTVDVQNLKEGTYFYTLQVGNQTKNGKVVKVK